jgi:hypothetical protein
MSLVTRGMGVSGSGTGTGFPVTTIVESIEGRIITEADVKAIIAIRPEVVGRIDNTESVTGKKESQDTIKTTITKKDTIKGKVDK